MSMKTDLVTKQKIKYYSHKLTWSLSKKREDCSHSFLYSKISSKRERKGIYRTLIF